MVRLSTGSEVCTPMSPRAALELSPDPERALVEIDVRPAKCEDLASPEAQANRDRPGGAVAFTSRGLEDLPGVRDRQWFDLGFQHPRRRSTKDGVASHAVSVDRVVERRADRPSQMLDDGGGLALTGQRPV
jgi:hypothetical protein